MQENPKYLPILDLQLKYLDQSNDRKHDAIQSAADEIISAIDVTALAAHYGMKITDADDPALSRVRKEMDKQKAFLINALYVKATTLMEKHGKQGINESVTNAITAFKAWGDIEDNGKFSSEHVDFGLGPKSTCSEENLHIYSNRD